MRTSDQRIRIQEAQKLTDPDPQHGGKHFLRQFLDKYLTYLLISNISSTDTKPIRYLIQSNSIAVRQARVRFSARPHREVSPTEHTSDEEMERGFNEWRRMYVL